MSDRTRKMLQDMIENFTAMGIFDTEIAVEGNGEGTVVGMTPPQVGDTVRLGSYLSQAIVYGIVDETPPYVEVRSWGSAVIGYIPTGFIEDGQPVEQILPRGVKSKVVNIKCEGTVQL